MLRFWKWSCIIILQFFLLESWKFTGKHLRWSHFSKKVSWPEDSLKRHSSTQIFLWILHNFSKNLIYRTPPMTVPADFSIPRFCFFLYYFPFINDNWNYGSLFRKAIIYTVIHPNTNMNVVKTICLGNNLQIHIKENTDFPWQMP